MQGDTEHKPRSVLNRLQEAIAHWEFLGWHGNAADKKRARELLPALRARLEIAKKNNGDVQ